MKKSLKKQLKKWKIGDYVRQFSIVTGGVLLTLWLTAQIADTAKQREVRQAMQLVALELSDNVEIIRKYGVLYEEEARIARRIMEKEFSPAAFTVDTASYYALKITNGLHRPFRFSTDALEMLKTSGLTAHIADKQQVIDLLRCYNRIESFDSNIALYFDLRKEALLDYDKRHPQAIMDRSPEAIARLFGRTIADESMRSWISSIPRSFDGLFFIRAEEQIEAAIARLEKRYGTSDNGHHAPSGQQQEEERRQEQDAQHGQQRAQTAPTLVAARQRVAQQRYDQPYQGRQDQTDQKGPAEADTAAAADDSYKHREQTAAQQAENNCEKDHGL